MNPVTEIKDQKAYDDETCYRLLLYCIHTSKMVILIPAGIRQ